MAAIFDLTEVRRLVGQELPTPAYNTEVTRPAIITFIRGIGDRNPLYHDEGYARRSVLGGIVAPPCWLYSVHDTVVAPKLPGLHAIYGAVDWEFYRLIRLGDTITPSSRLLDVQEIEGRLAGPTVVQTAAVTYVDQRGQTVARATAKTFRVDRAAAAARGKYKDWTRHRYSREEAHAVEDGYDNERIQGYEPRYWEEAEVGATLTPVVKGPLTEEDTLQFATGTRALIGFKKFAALRQRHPEVAFRHPDTNVWSDWKDGLLEDKVAQLYGFPFAHDQGIDRVSWLGNLVTNWMGDWGQLRRLQVELRLPNVHGDTQWCRGRVADKREQDGEGLVDLEVWCQSQRGAVTARGMATVALPTTRIQ